MVNIFLEKWDNHFTNHPPLVDFIISKYSKQEEGRAFRHLLFKPAFIKDLLAEI